MSLKMVFYAAVLGANLLNAETSYKVGDHFISGNASIGREPNGSVLNALVALSAPVLVWIESADNAGRRGDKFPSVLPPTFTSHIAKQAFDVERALTEDTDRFPTITDDVLAIGASAVQMTMGLPGCIAGSLGANVKNFLFPAGEKSPKEP